MSDPLETLTDVLSVEARKAEINAMVEVILPIKGNPRYLNESLKSIYSDCGFWPNICFCIDTVSPDSMSIIHSLIPKHRFRVITCNNKTLAEALSIGCETSKYSYIARMDADDLMINSRLQSQKAFLDKNHDVAVYGSVAKVIFVKNPTSKLIGKPSTDKTGNEILKYGCSIPHSSVMFRRDSILEVGNYRDFFVYKEKSIAEDYFLWLRVQTKYLICVSPEPYLGYRIHDEQVSNSLQSALMAASLYIRAHMILSDLPEAKIKVAGENELKLWLLAFKLILKPRYLPFWIRDFLSYLRRRELE